MKVLALLIFILGIFTETAHGQTVTSPIMTIANTKIIKASRINTRSGISILPLSALGSGLDLCFDVFNKHNTDAKFILGYYSAQNPWFYKNALGSMHSDDVGSYTSTLTEMQGFKGEIQVRKLIGSNSNNRVAYSIGGFLQFRNISAIKKVSYIDLSNGATITEKNSLQASALFLGPVYNIDFLLSKFMYMQLGIGAGYVIPLGENDAEIFDIILVNPYERSIGLKINYAIGFYLN